MEFLQEEVKRGYIECDKIVVVTNALDNSLKSVLKNKNFTLYHINSIEKGRLFFKLLNKLIKNGMKILVVIVEFEPFNCYSMSLVRLQRFNGFRKLIRDATKGKVKLILGLKSVYNISAKFRSSIGRVLLFPTLDSWKMSDIIEFELLSNMFKISSGIQEELLKAADYLLQNQADMVFIPFY